MAGVAHEVNNPLAGLKNCLGHLHREDLPPDRKAEYLELMEEALDRIQGVVQRLLDYARVRPPNRARLSVNRLLSGARGLVGSSLASRELTVEVHLPDEEVWVEAEEGQIEQAAVNLLINAIHATPRGGSSGWTPGRSTGWWASPSATGGPASHPPSGTRSRIPSSPPSPRARGPVWGCR